MKGIGGCGRGSRDGEGQQRHVVLLGQADLGRRRVEGRLEGAVERAKRDLEVDDIASGRLHRVRLEDGVDGEDSPDLRALLGNDGEADLVVAELDPRERTERVERRRELCTRMVSPCT